MAEFATATKQNWKFIETMEKMESFFNDMENIMIDGVPVHDKYGHNNAVSYRVQPMQSTIHNKLIESLPDNWFKGNGDFHRKKDMLGCKCMMTLLLSREIMPPTLIDKYTEIIRKMNMIARVEQEASLEQQFDELQYKLNKSDKVDAKKVSRDIELIRESIKELNKMR